jgi:UDP-glucuronate 4-epimerase
LLVRALVTGAAGFIGSALVEHLVARGFDVVGLDNFSAYYDLNRKRANLRDAQESERFQLVEADLLKVDLGVLVESIDVVFHQAAQPGVRSSWSSGFQDYLENNVLATQRLLEAVRGVELKRFVYASSSSVYGIAKSYPTYESDPVQPHSPYGVTKLAGEHLVNVYGKNFGVPTISLRYHTVYGPRQRPDMAVHRLIEAALSGEQFPLYGANAFVRDFTYVADVVRANGLALEQDSEPGSVVNVAGGSSTTMTELIDLVSELTGEVIRIDELPGQPGDVVRTGGSNELAERLIGWKPETALRDGIAAQVAWHQSLRIAAQQF